MGWKIQLTRCAGPVCALVLAGQAATPQAGSGAPGPATDDLAYGEYLAGECVTCHRPDGTEAGIPDITGMPVAEFTRALQAYQNGTRNHAIMRMVTGRLGDGEIAALASYFKDLE